MLRMNMIQILDYLVWVLFWFLGMGMLLLLPKNRRDYIKNWIIISGYFLVVSFAALYFFQNILSTLYEKLTFFPLFILLSFFLFNFAGYFLSHRLLKKPVEIIEKYSNLPFLSLDYRYMISKAFEIFYQQILIIVLIYILRYDGFSIFWITVAFVFLFGFAHLPALRLYHETWFGILIFLSALFSAFFFPYIILNFSYGFVYTYITHFLFYTNSGILFWLVHQVAKIKKGKRNK